MNIPHGLFNKSEQPIKCLFWVTPTRKLYDLFWAIHGMKEQNPARGGRALGQARGRVPAAAGGVRLFHRGRARRAHAGIIHCVPAVPLLGCAFDIRTQGFSMLRLIAIFVLACGVSGCASSPFSQAPAAAVAPTVNQNTPPGTAGTN